jgi:hypothetical protein
VSQEFNRYWWLMLAPLYCFGIDRAPAALADLWQAAKMPALRKLAVAAEPNGVYRQCDPELRSPFVSFATSWRARGCATASNGPASGPSQRLARS